MTMQKKPLRERETPGALATYAHVLKKHNVDMIRSLDDPATSKRLLLQLVLSSTTTINDTTSSNSSSSSVSSSSDLEAPAFAIGIFHAVASRCSTTMHLE